MKFVVIVMKYMLSGWLALVLLLSACTGPDTTAIVVRHAEKELVGSDPGLTGPGRQRARDLAVSLENLDIAAVYSTGTKRTRQTAGPLADSLGLPVQTYTTPSAIAATVLAQHAGDAVLIVGHSNTVGAIVTEFGAVLPDGLSDPIDDNDYDNLVTVVIDGKGEATAVHSTYGTPSPR